MVSPGPFRSKKVLAHAKGQPCTLRLDDYCDGGGVSGTTVACHIRDEHKGMGIKASDHSIVFGCAYCHRVLDEGKWIGDREWSGSIYWHIVRALQETWAILIADGIIGFPIDKPLERITVAEVKNGKLIKHEAVRASKPIPKRPFQQGSRPFASKPFNKERS